MKLKASLLLLALSASPVEAHVRGVTHSNRTVRPLAHVRKLARVMGFGGEPNDDMIPLGLFTDDTCTLLLSPPNGNSHELFYSDQSLIRDGECRPCIDGVCQDVYLRSGKCETNLPWLDEPTTNACDYVKIRGGNETNTADSEWTEKPMEGRGESLTSGKAEHEPESDSALASAAPSQSFSSVVALSFLSLLGLLFYN